MHACPCRTIIQFFSDKCYIVQPIHLAAVLLNDSTLQEGKVSLFSSCISKAGGDPVGSFIGSKPSMHTDLTP